MSKPVPIRALPTGEDFIEGLEEVIGGMQMALRYPEWAMSWLEFLGMWPLKPEVAAVIDNRVRILPVPEKEDVS